MSSQRHQKRKRKHHDEVAFTESTTLDTTKPSAVFVPTTGRLHTVSVAVPGSILRNAGTRELKTVLAGQIARACAVFCVDEIVVFNDGQTTARPPDPDGYTGYTDPDKFLSRLLTYLETPPYLRRSLIPKHADFESVGLAPSLDMPHHLRSEEWCPYREGVTLRKGTDDEGRWGTVVDCGLAQKVFLPEMLDDNSRVTIKLPDPAQAGRRGMLRGEAVSPDTPREEAGYYWGYRVRHASSLSAIFTECEFDGGYDMSIGTSERGAPVHSAVSPSGQAYVEPVWSHLLVVFGGVAGLEAAFRADRELQSTGVSEAKEVFDRWINILPQQGSRTIRTEEATWIALARLRPVIDARSPVA